MHQRRLYFSWRRARNWKCIEYEIGPCVCVWMRTQNGRELLLRFFLFGNNNCNNTQKHIKNFDEPKIYAIYSALARCGWLWCVRAKCNTSLAEAEGQFCVKWKLQEKMTSDTDTRDFVDKAVIYIVILVCTKRIRVFVWANLIWFRYLLFMWFHIFDRKCTKNESNDTTKWIWNIHIYRAGQRCALAFNTPFDSIELFKCGDNFHQDNWMQTLRASAEHLDGQSEIFSVIFIDEEILTHASTRVTLGLWEKEKIRKRPRWWLFCLEKKIIKMYVCIMCDACVCESCAHCAWFTNLFNEIQMWLWFSAAPRPVFLLRSFHFFIRFAIHCTLCFSA